MRLPTYRQFAVTASYALLVGLTFFTCVSSANVSNFQLRNFSVQQGLSQSTILDIDEDKYGFIWFATASGLNRFDGKNFKQYFPVSKDINSLQGEFIRNLFIDSTGNLWVSSENGGIARYSHERDNFTVYDANNSQLAHSKTWAMAELPDGQLIVSGEDKLYRFDASQDDFIPAEFEGVALKDTIRTLYVEPDRVWIGSKESGIFALDISSNTLFKISGDEAANPWGINLPPKVKVLYDMKRINDHLWLATDKGVLVISPKNLVVNHIQASKEEERLLPSNDVNSIEQADPNHLWFATREGLSIYNIKQQTAFIVDQENDILAGLSSRLLLKVFKDSNDAIWLGTHSGGAFQYHPQFSRIKHFKSLYQNSFSNTDNSVWALEEYKDGLIWVITQNGGVSLFNSISGRFTRFLANEKFNIWDGILDDENRLWLATDVGIRIYQYEEDTEQLHFVTTLLKDKIVVDVRNLGKKIWAKAWVNGNVHYKIDKTPDQPQITEIRYNDVNIINPLHQDNNDDVWLDTEAGLAVIDSQTDNITYIQLLPQDINIEQPSVQNVHETENGLWIATAKHGLFELDKDSHRLIRNENPRGTDMRGRVFNSMMYGPEQDTVWQSSHSEVWQISLKTGSIMQSVSRDVLDYNDLNQGSGLVTKSGLILFGGAQGFHIFDPAQLQSSELLKKVHPQPQPPNILEISIRNEPINLESAGTLLNKPIYLTENIELANIDTPISLTFGQINPLFADYFEYRYRLTGLEDEWNYAGKVPAAHYTNYLVGNYTFEVQSKYLNSPWSDSKQLSIHVLPPFYLHQSALVIYSLIAVLLLAYIYKEYKRRVNVQTAIRESEERLKLTLWSSGDELWDWDVYRGQVYRANTWGTIDFPQDDIRANSSYNANIHQNDMTRVQEALKKHIKGESDHYQVTYRARTFKGDWIWILDRGMIVKRDSNNQPLRMTGTLKNISHLKQAEEQLKLFKRSIETISDGVFIADTDFHFISVNQSYCLYTGETREQALASYLKFNQYPDAFTEEVKKALRQRGNWNGEVESRRVNGEKFEMELNIDAIQGEDGKISHYVGVFSDITVRKSTEQELLKLANTDPLTEMPNRSFFQASHDNLVRKDVAHALICLDMDNFKKINDSLGHQTGDVLIKQIGKRLQKIAGNNATCYRLGGDEFSILIDLPEQMSRINHYAQRILDQMAYPFLINKQEFVLGASVGIAFYPEDGTSPQELLKNADTAMYFAKNAGGNKYQFFSGEMNQNAVRQLQIENLIRYGLKDDLFTVFYQPKVDISTGKLVSMEALVRFEHPEKGIVSPSQFIPLAEETGQIIEIGEQVLFKACQETKRWVSLGLFTGRVAVNISARQFELPDLDDRILHILQKVGLSPLHLECEITEGTIMQNPDQALQMMQRLREKGIHLALDDFGTGYSSLAYLKKFPLNTLKIDKAFIDDIAISNVDKHMTAAIINIAHNLGLKVVAEGVEQEEQLAILKRYECEMLQGYLYSKPLSSGRFEKLLKENLHINQLLGKTVI